MKSGRNDGERLFRIRSRPLAVGTAVTEFDLLGNLKHEPLLAGDCLSTMIAEPHGRLSNRPVQVDDNLESIIARLG